MPDINPPIESSEPAPTEDFNAGYKAGYASLEEFNVRKVDTLARRNASLFELNEKLTEKYEDVCETVILQIDKISDLDEAGEILNERTDRLTGDLGRALAEVDDLEDAISKLRSETVESEDFNEGYEAGYASSEEFNEGKINDLNEANEILDERSKASEAEVGRLIEEAEFRCERVARLMDGHEYLKDLVIDRDALIGRLTGDVGRALAEVSELTKDQSETMKGKSDSPTPDGDIEEIKRNIEVIEKWHARCYDLQSKKIALAVLGRHEIRMNIKASARLVYWTIGASILVSAVFSSLLHVTGIQ